MDVIQEKSGDYGDSPGRGRGADADAADDGGHIVFVTKTTMVNEAKPAVTKPVAWHSGGGIVTRIGESTTMRTILKTTSVSESIRTYSSTPQETKTTMQTKMTITEGVTTWFTDMPTATQSVASTILPSTTITIPTTTGSSAPDGDEKLPPIIGGSVGGFLVLLFVFGGLTGLYKVKATKNQAVVDFDATAGTGSHSTPHHDHESFGIGCRPQAAPMAAEAGQSQAGPSTAIESHGSDQHFIAELPGDNSYYTKLRDSHNEPV